jgi:hypothetical protein
MYVDLLHNRRWRGDHLLRVLLTGVSLRLDSVKVSTIHEVARRLATCASPDPGHNSFRRANGQLCHQRGIFHRAQGLRTRTIFYMCVYY